MSRSGYTYDLDSWALVRWRGAVASAIRGRRGQSFLREMRSALDALPAQKLAKDILQQGGEVCALGAVGLARQMDMSKVDPDDHESVSSAFGIPGALAREVMELNDGYIDTPESRWARVRKWVEENLRS